MHLTRSKLKLKSCISSTPGTTIYPIDGWLLIFPTEYFISHICDLFQRNKAVYLALQEPAVPAPPFGEIDHPDIPARARTTPAVIAGRSGVESHPDGPAAFQGGTADLTRTRRRVQPDHRTLEAGGAHGKISRRFHRWRGYSRPRHHHPSPANRRNTRARRLPETIDLIAGTSTGGLLALGIAHQVGLAKIRDLYVERGSKIFDDSWPDDPPIGQPRGADHDIKSPRRELKASLGISRSDS